MRAQPTRLPRPKPCLDRAVNDEPSLATIAKEWGRIGCVGFGGPPAHIALLRELCVERRRWLSAREVEDANAACQLLLGPASTQLAIYCAGRAAGPVGAVLGGLAFIRPGPAMIGGLAARAHAPGPADWLRGVGAGAGAAVVAVIVAAGIGLARASLAGRHGGARAWALAYLAAGALATVFLGPRVVLVLLGAGLVELARRRRPGAAVHAWPALLVLGATGAAALPALAWTALKVGALSYGGGFVIIPLMHGDAVDARGWMT